MGGSIDGIAFRRGAAQKVNVTYSLTPTEEAEVRRLIDEKEAELEKVRTRVDQGAKSDKAQPAKSSADQPSKSSSAPTRSPKPTSASPGATVAEALRAENP